MKFLNAFVLISAMAAFSSVRIFQCHEICDRNDFRMLIWTISPLTGLSMELSKYFEIIPSCPDFNVSEKSSESFLASRY